MALALVHGRAMKRTGLLRQVWLFVEAAVIFYVRGDGGNVARLSREIPVLLTVPVVAWTAKSPASPAGLETRRCRVQATVDTAIKHSQQAGTSFLQYAHGIPLHGDIPWDKALKKFKRATPAEGRAFERAVESQMPVFCVSLTNKIIVLAVKSVGSTMASLEDALQSSEGIPPHQVRFISNGRPLLNRGTLEDQHIVAGSLVFFVLRFRGGGL